MADIKPETYFKDTIRNRDEEAEDAMYTGSANALSTLGITAGIGTALTGNKRLGSALMLGTGGGALGYHAARLAKASPGLRLLVAAMTGTAAGTLGFIHNPIGNI